MTVIKFEGAHIHATIAYLSVGFLKAECTIVISSPLAPQFNAVVLMKYGVEKTISHAKKKPMVIATPNV